MFGRANLSRWVREMVATLVSNINECHYWVTHYGVALHKLINDKETVEILNSILTNYKESDISNKKMLKYAEKLTKKSSL